MPRRMMGAKGRGTDGDGGGSRSGGGRGDVFTLVPGATATFEVAATAPAEVADGTVRMEVRARKAFLHDGFFKIENRRGQRKRAREQSAPPLFRLFCDFLEGKNPLLSRRVYYVPRDLVCRISFRVSVSRLSCLIC